MSVHSGGIRATRKFAKGDRRRLPPTLATKIAKVLQRLERGASPADLREAGYSIHRLTGDRNGAHAKEISGGWRVVFRFHDGSAHDVTVVDYYWN